MNNKPVDFYNNKIKELKTKFQLVSYELIKSYPLYKININNPEYENIYNNDNQNLEITKSDIFLLKNSIEKDNNNLTEILNLVNNKIIKQKNTNDSLKKKYNNLLSINNASTGLINQQQELYNIKKTDIILLSCGIISILVLFKFSNH